MFVNYVNCLANYVMNVVCMLVYLQKRHAELQTEFLFMLTVVVARILTPLAVLRYFRPMAYFRFRG